MLCLCFHVLLSKCMKIFPVAAVKSFLSVPDLALLIDQEKQTENSRHSSLRKMGIITVSFILIFVLTV